MKILWGDGRENNNQPWVAAWEGYEGALWSDGNSYYLDVGGGYEVHSHVKVH